MMNGKNSRSNLRLFEFVMEKLFQPFQIGPVFCEHRITALNVLPPVFRQSPISRFRAFNMLAQAIHSAVAGAF